MIEALLFLSGVVVVVVDVTGLIDENGEPLVE